MKIRTNRISQMRTGGILSAAALALALLAGCAGNSEANRPTTDVRVLPVQDSQQQSSGAAANDLPAISAPQTTARDVAPFQIEELELVDEDMRVVIRTLAETFGLDYQIDPAIEGRVSTHLRLVSLEDALSSIVTPHGYDYQIQNGVLRVSRNRMETRIFTLDYLSLSRTGVGTTVVQRRLGGGQTGGQTAAGGGGDAIQSVAVLDLWQEIGISLEGLVFENGCGGGNQQNGGGLGGIAAVPGGQTGGQTGAQPNVGGGNRGQQGRATGASSCTSPDGRRLILTPASGTIVVTAPPHKLADVETFIRTVEGSVQRQVLIEAKIVEITLNRQYEFGVDWSFLRNLGGLGVRLATGASGVEFTLGGPNTTDEQRVEVVIDALESQGTVQVLSAPRVSVMNNQPSVMSVTTDQVFFAVSRTPVLGPTGGAISFNTQIEPQSVAVGITLNVLAQISPDNTITMNVRPAITDIVSVTSIELEDGTQASAPVIDRRETDTVVRVRDGETIVIGGLMQNTRSTDGTGVPVLRDIPGLGALFGRKSSESRKRELVIFITPTIIAGQAALR